ncbi:MAG: anhydro-N-acetylmuramic acid kinase [Methylococcales symbiont of Iophon sp. n. MRB-2018]|nr:MAG: anhydro-N-acetylmuramic acid kinase [Methylococcales symbiont of Iophon sp. n. MRB-2018]
MAELYIGLMSGTSIDGIDAALVKFDNNTLELLGFEYSPYSSALKKTIQTISQANTPILLREYGTIDAQLGQLFANTVEKLLKKTKTLSSSITAIGSHGQTVYHAADSIPPFSLQIGDPNIIAEQTGITTVADFRRRDIAAKGQGAPLVPAFHQAYFCKLFDLSKHALTVVNIGGIANISYLTKNYTLGFDTGPGNTLMDYWMEKNNNKHYDNAGNWAKSGTVNAELLKHLKDDPYFSQSPPKSTGKEYFSANWLEDKLSAFLTCKAEDVQASLCQFSADTVTDAIQQYAPLTGHSLICGGGIHNENLIQLIKNNLNHPVESTEKFGINPDYVEAVAFAWLAKQSIHNLAGNLPQVTGAKKSVVLGGIYPGKNGIS